MKIRNGFVSNSSSTSFTFCFKGKDLKSLTDLLLTKYRNQFKRSFEEWHCNVLDVVEAMEGCFESDFHRKISVYPIDNYIREEKAAVDRYTKDIKEHTGNQQKYLLDIFTREKLRCENKLKRLKTIKKRGLKSVVVIGFGDNHGDIQGGNLGYAMDYDGRYIDINNNDLVVFTELNR